MPHAAEDTDMRRKRLRYRSWHRGCKETDVILGRFCDAWLDGMDERELDQFEQILAQDDADLWQYLIGGESPPPALDSPVMQRLIAFDASK